MEKENPLLALLERTAALSGGLRRLRESHRNALQVEVERKRLGEINAVWAFEVQAAAFLGHEPPASEGGEASTLIGCGDAAPGEQRAPWGPDRPQFSAAAALGP